MATPAVSAVDAASGAADELQPQPLARPVDWHGPAPSETESVGSLSPRTTEPDSDMSSDYAFYLRDRWSRPQPVDSWRFYFWGRVPAYGGKVSTDPGWMPLCRYMAAHPLERASFLVASATLLSRPTP